MKKFPVNYTETLISLKERISKARYRTMQKINTEMIELYWDIGKTLSHKTNDEGWGKSVVEALSIDLQTAFKGVKGFSARNLWYMKRFYESYAENEKLQRLVAEIPRGQNIEIFTKLKPMKNAFFILYPNV